MASALLRPCCDAAKEYLHQMKSVDAQADSDSGASRVFSYRIQ